MYLEGMEEASIFVHVAIHDVCGKVSEWLAGGCVGAQQLSLSDLGISLHSNCTVLLATWKCFSHTVHSNPGVEGCRCTVDSCGGPATNRLLKVESECGRSKFRATRCWGQAPHGRDDDDNAIVSCV